MKELIKDLIKGLRCEDCPNSFGERPDSSPDNLYVYTDIIANTRCFCKKHMSYCKEDSPALLQYGDNWDSPCYGAKLISDLLGK